MCRKIIVIGAGGHGRVVKEIIKKCGDIFIGFLDDQSNENEVIGKISDCELYKDSFFVIAIGNNQIRKNIADKYGYLKYCTVIHPSAVISDSCHLGKGTVVMPNAVINANAVVGDHCIINTGAIVEHDNLISDFVHISPNATLCGNVSVGKCTHIGASATVKNNITIVNNCIIGINGAVVKNINMPGIYIGIPVKKKV